MLTASFCWLYWKPLVFLTSVHSQGGCVAQGRLFTNAHRYPICRKSPCLILDQRDFLPVRECQKLWWQMLSRLTVVVILQHTYLESVYCTPELLLCYMSIILQLKRREQFHLQIIVFLVLSLRLPGKCFCRVSITLNRYWDINWICWFVSLLIT